MLQTLLGFRHILQLSSRLQVKVTKIIQILLFHTKTQKSGERRIYWYWFFSLLKVLDFAWQIGEKWALRLKK